MKKLIVLCLLTMAYSVVALSQTITTQNITGSYCGGSTLSVSFSTTGTFLPGNTFRLMLSSPTGGWGSAVQIGSLTGNTAGTIVGTIPTSITSGTGYRVRVVSTSPAITGSNNGSNLTMNPRVTPTVSITSNLSGTQCPGSTFVFTATPVHGGTSPIYQWTLDGVNAGTNSATFTTSSITNGQSVKCVLTSNVACATTNTATSNSIVVSIGDTTPPTVSCPANITTSVSPGMCGAKVNYSLSVSDNCSTSLCGPSSIPGYTLIGTYNGHRYFRSNTTALWPAANSAALALGGHLVTINDAAENALFSGMGLHWIGFSDAASEGIWTWCTGENVTYTNWNNAEPNNSGNEDYAVINVSGNRWNDIGTATSGTYPYIVEFECLTVNLTHGLSSGSIFPVGTTTVTHTATDASGNTSAPCSFTVTVMDNVAPTINTPNNITVNAGNSCTAVVNYPAPTASDNCGNCTAGSTIAGFTFLGLRAGKAYYISNSSVNYNNALNMAFNAGGAIASIVNADDNAQIRSWATAAGSGNYWIGLNDVATEGTFVWQGGEPFSYSNWAANEPNNGSNSDYVQVRANGLWIDVLGTSNARFVMSTSCMTASRVSGPASGSTFPLGTTPITFRASDAYGNIGTRTFNVTVLDATSPSITCPGPMNLTLGNNCTAVLPDYRSMAVVTDNCSSGGAIVITQTPAPGTSVGGTGTTTVTLTATDASNNSSSCSFTVTRTATPLVSITSNRGASICNGTSVTFTATPTLGGTAPTYQWRVNGTVVGTNSATYTTTTLTNGAAVTCRMTSNASCTNGVQVTSNTINMSVGAPVTPSVTISTPSTTICLGSTATFTANPVNGGTTPSYQWRVNGVNAGTNSPTFTTSALANGSVISCVMTSSLPCATPASPVSNSITMVVSSVVPTISISSSSTTVCAGTSVSFTSAITNGGSTPNYSWRVNGVTVGTNSSTFSSAALNQGDVVSCVLTSNAACASPSVATSNSIAMTVNALVTPTVTINSSSTTICSGGTVSFTASIANGGTTPSYQWRVNGTVVGTNSATFSSSSLMNGSAVRCVLTSNASCTTSTTATSNTITMTVNSVTPTIAISAPTSSICAGSAITFSSNITNGGLTPSYQWRVNGINAGSNSPSFTTTTLANGDVVTCSLTSTVACATSTVVSSNSISMAVNPIVTPSISIASSANNVCSGTTITFTSSVTNGGANPAYQWRVNGQNVSSNTSTYTTNGLNQGDVVTCLMTSNASCVSPSVVSSNAITMNFVTVTPTISIAANTATICEGSVVTFNSTIGFGGSAPTFIWFLNGANTGVTTSSFTTSSLMDGDVVRCQLISNNTCAQPTQVMSDDIVVSVHAPTVPEISIESDATGSICAGTNVNFLATITSGGTAPVFEWRVNNIPSGINDDSFSSTTLTNGSVITCRLISNETCAISTPVTSNTVVISVMELVSPQVTIDIEMLGTACTGNAANFVAQTVNCGTTTNYQWRKNGNPFGPNSASFTSGAFNSGDSFTCAITTNTNCAASTSAISNSLTLAVQGPGTYYLDADGDGFGDNSTAIAACTAPFGYVSIGNDCDDDNMDVNPGVDEWPNDIDDNCDSEIDEEGVLYTYYLDQDDDGYGDSNNSIQEFYLIPGYVTVGGDCNDGDFSVHPFAVEICSNGIDEDCDGSIDEACTPLNDDKEFSFILPISPNGDCWTYDGTLSNASVSTEAHSTCISGNDVWYHFGAPEPGISLQVISEHDDVLLELQDENGNTLDVENSVSGIGVEILNYNQLVAGESYWLIVRNYNTAVGTGGAFSVCGNVLFDTRVTNGNTVNASMCTLIACQPVNAENYIFRFQESVSNNTISYTSSIPTINLSVIPGLVYGTTYSVTVDALYQRSNGAGVMENLLISGTSSAILNLTQHKLLSVANSFACPNVVTPGTVISTQGFVCAAEGYDWEIVQIAPVALGAVVIYSETGNFFNLMNIPGIAPGSAYQIRVRPVFAGGIRGSYGEQKCIQVIEYSNMNEPEIATAASDLEPQIDFVPYPNPSRDGELNINSTGLDGKPARITIRSITGQHIHSESFAAISESFSIELPQQLAVGMYLITIETTEEKSITKHWMIEN